jgi:copper chaperone CopZ
VTCAHAVRVAAQKVDGVESVEVSLRKPTVVRLRPGNRVTLDQFRQLVKNNGFELKGITVTALARPSEQRGKPAIEVSGIGTVLLAARGNSDGRAYDQLIELVRSNKTATIEVTGAVEKDNKDGTEEITITGVREIKN